MGQPAAKTVVRPTAPRDRPVQRERARGVNVPIPACLRPRQRPPALGTRLVATRCRLMERGGIMAFGPCIAPEAYVRSRARTKRSDEKGRSSSPIHRPAATCSSNNPRIRPITSHQAEQAGRQAQAGRHSPDLDLNHHKVPALFTPPATETIRYACLASLV
uniref:Uncharacterized protein n=1 Tax=Oryza sativa subsp. japonica TaxID=39947 RepID=Q69MC3_ORYSJ|nr:hypothetical protein [Oryza sativa Japonica Group]